MEYYWTSWAWDWGLGLSFNKQTKLFFSSACSFSLIHARPLHCCAPPHHLPTTTQTLRQSSSTPPTSRRVLPPATRQGVLRADDFDRWCHNQGSDCRGEPSAHIGESDRVGQQTEPPWLHITGNLTPEPSSKPQPQLHSFSGGGTFIPSEVSCARTWGYPGGLKPTNRFCRVVIHSC